MSEPVKLPRGWIFTKFDECIDHIIGGDWGNPISQKIQKEFVKVHVLRSTELKNWKECSHGNKIDLIYLGHNQLSIKKYWLSSTIKNNISDEKYT